MDCDTPTETTAEQNETRMNTKMPLNSNTVKPSTSRSKEGTKLSTLNPFHRHSPCSHSQGLSLTVCPKAARALDRFLGFHFRANRRRRGLLVRVGRLGLLGQAADWEVVNHLLDLLHVVLEAVVALPQGVVLQVQEAEARVQLVDEVGDSQRASVVPRCDAVHR